MRQKRRSMLLLYEADGRIEKTQGEEAIMFGLSKGKVKTILKITDMECSMCETRINEALRRSLGVKSVRSSAGKHETVIWSDEPLPEDRIRDIIKDTGYTLIDITSIIQ